MSISLPLLLLLLVEMVSSSQRIVVGPKNSSVLQGGSIILRCEFTDRRGDVLWSRNAQIHHQSSLSPSGRYSIRTGANFSEFRIRDAQSDVDDADWSCQLLATETAKPQQSNFARLTVLVPPRGPFLPASTSIRADVPQNITCEVLGGSGPPPTFFWTVDDVNRSSSAVLFIIRLKKLWNASSVLELNGQIKSKNMVVDCAFSHPAIGLQNRSTSQTFNVIYAPRVKLRERATNGVITVREGDTVVLHCEATANPGLISYRWYRNSEKLPRALSSKLNLGSVSSRSHGNNYTCEASNSVGTTKVTGSLHVTFPPKLAKFDPIIGADLGTIITIPCPIISNPSPPITWYRMPDGNAISRDTRNLTVEVSSASSFGSYRCSAQRSGLSAEVTLIRFAPPKVSAQRERTFATAGYEAVLECRIEGLPLADIIIWKTGQERSLSPTNPRYAIEEKTETSSVRISVLRIADMKNSDFGPYNCTANNRLGTGFAIITVLEEGTFKLSWIVAVAVTVVSLVIFLIAFIVICRYARTKSKEKEAQDHFKKMESASQESGSKESGQSPTTSFELVSSSSTEMSEHNKDNYSRPNSYRAPHPHNSYSVTSSEHPVSSYPPSIIHTQTFYDYDSHSNQLSPSYHSPAGYPPDYRYPDFVPTIPTASRTSRLSTNV